MAFKAKAKVGDQVEGETLSGKPRSGVVARVHPEMGYQLADGTWLKTITKAPNVESAADVLKKWATPAARTEKYRVESVLAGAYKGGRENTGPTLSHAVFPGASKSACGKIAVDSLAGYDEGGTPSCSACARKVAKA